MRLNTTRTAVILRIVKTIAKSDLKGGWPSSRLFFEDLCSMAFCAIAPL